MQHLTASERKELPRQLRRLICGCEQILDVGACIVLAALDALERELAVAADRQQKVVEVVGDPAGEVTDRLEPV